MSIELYQDEFGSIQHYPGEHILELRWSQATQNMSDDDFKRWLILLGEYAIDKSSYYLVVDVRDFRATPSTDVVGPWRDEHVVPLYNQAGTRKFAFLVPPATPGPSEAEDIGSEMPLEGNGIANFQTRYFSSWESIRAWFAENE